MGSLCLIDKVRQLERGEIVAALTEKPHVDSARDKLTTFQSPSPDVRPSPSFFALKNKNKPERKRRKTPCQIFHSATSGTDQRMILPSSGKKGNFCNRTEKLSFSENVPERVGLPSNAPCPPKRLMRKDYAIKLCQQTCGRVSWL